MKVLKFGGTSVGSVEPLKNVRNIVLGRNEGVVVVVSALGGITDRLLEAADAAKDGGRSFLDIFNSIKERHLKMVSELFSDSGTAEAVRSVIEGRLDDLLTLLNGVNTLKVLPAKTEAEIVSFGERMSSVIVSALIDGSTLYDPLEFIKTKALAGKNVLDSELTEKLIKDRFDGFDKSKGIAIVPGFISTDASTGEITNLGRGGSDYTASILAAVLNAECLEIWTDVDGFMTADPRKIKTSYVIEELSLAEAMELCNFGAKVVYPPALYPVYPKDIPVHIKNTFNPSAKGTVIRRNSLLRARAVTGISSISDVCMLTVSGTSMAGVVGIDARIFSALAKENISVFLVSQSASETNISLGVKAEAAPLALRLLSAEFSHEISEGSMDTIKVMDNLAAVAIVGEQMRKNAGTAGKLFSVLGRNGISIIACAQGTEERNISFVIEQNDLQKALNVIHDSFFLSEYQELNLFICGTGTVGGNLIDQIAAQREKLMKERNLKINVVGIARSRCGIFSRDGIDLDNYKELLAGGQPMTLSKLRDEVIGMNIFNSIFVDCTASAEVASLYKDFFDHGISVVAANKIAASSSYENYSELKNLARKRGVKYLFETNVGAGLPIINTINALRNSGDKIQRIEAVVSGTLNFIFNTISEDIPFSRTVKMAQEQGYSEPDPRIDLSGKDVIRKLVILAREAGYVVNQEDVDANLFIPREFFDCTLEEFWQKLPSLDEYFEKERKRLAAEHKRWRFVASIEDGKYSVSLREFKEGHSFYVLEGSNNIVLLTTERYHDYPLLIQGYGAGASVTAAGVFADIISIANVN